MQQKKMLKNKTALTVAVDLLARRSHGTQELKAKLMRKGFSEAEITLAVEKLTARGYLDDAAHLEAIVLSYKAMKKYSRREIAYKLMQKGFEREGIEKFIGLIDDSDELLAAEKIAAQKYKAKGDAVKIKRQLYNHGFSQSVIKQALEKFNDE
jgi:regulatory protein